MNRYFLEVGYKGTRYSGFQVQENALTVQYEVERAMETFFRTRIELTGSSRTDAGVHAIQNFFHFDFEGEFPQPGIYNLNAILPADIVIRSVRQVEGALPQVPHARFSALSREYDYYLYNTKDPFKNDRAYFFPYTVNVDLLKEAARLIYSHTDFTSFSKRKTQVKTFECTIMNSEWSVDQNELKYTVKANRFLRGMVRGLVGTMLQVGRGRLSLRELEEIILKRDCTLADFSVPAHGLFLVRVEYPKNIFV